MSERRLKKSSKPIKAVLTKKNATYAVAAGLIADIVVSVVEPEYTGFFSRLAALLTGGG